VTAEARAGPLVALGAAGDGGGLLDIQGRHATELAAVRRILERPPAMHRGAVVPDHEIPNAPRMPVHEFPLGCVLDQIPQEQPPLGHRPVDHP
jgi:hypothetical protein